MSYTTLTKQHLTIIKSALKTQRETLINSRDIVEDSDLKEFFDIRMNQNKEALAAFELCENENIHLQFVKQ